MSLNSWSNLLSLYCYYSCYTTLCCCYCNHSVSLPACMTSPKSMSLCSALCPSLSVLFFTFLHFCTLSCYSLLYLCLTSPKGMSLCPALYCPVFLLLKYLDTSLHLFSNLTSTSPPVSTIQTTFSLTTNPIVTVPTVLVSPPIFLTPVSVNSLPYII